jgi:hypothetical protein
MHVSQGIGAREQKKKEKKKKTCLEGVLLLSHIP